MDSNDIKKSVEKAIDRESKNLLEVFGKMPIHLTVGIPANYDFDYLIPLPDFISTSPYAMWLACEFSRIYFCHRNERIK